MTFSTIQKEQNGLLLTDHIIQFSSRKNNSKKVNFERGISNEGIQKGGQKDRKEN